MPHIYLSMTISSVFPAHYISWSLRLIFLYITVSVPCPFLTITFTFPLHLRFQRGNGLWALKFSPVNKMACFNAWVRYFVWNFKGDFWNSTRNILPIHWKMRFLYNIEILRALGFKSSSVFLKRPPGHYLYGVVHHRRCRHGGHHRYCCCRCCREPWQLLFLQLLWLQKPRTWLQLSQAQGKSQMITSWSVLKCLPE